MAENLPSQNSLQELAVLLSHLYDHYIKNQKFLINGLVSFLGDMGILSNSITVIEIENVRRKIQTQDTKHSSIMSYEEFYLWLRGVACCLYSSSPSSCPKKSLHKFLVEKIIPFGSNWGVFVFSESLQNTVQHSILEGVLHFHELFRHWYIYLTLKVPHQSSLGIEWKNITDNHAVLLIDELLNNLEDIGLVPRMISSIELQNFIQKVATTSAALSRYPDNTLNFSDFLLVIGFISSSISLYESTGSSSALTMYHSGLHLLVQTVSEYFLALGLRRWNPLDRQVTNVKRSIQDMIHDLPSTIYHLQPILLLCRRGGIIQSSQDFCTILDAVNSLVSLNPIRQTNSDSTPFMVPASKVPLLISTSSRRCHQTRSAPPSHPKKDKSSLIYNTDSPEKYLHPVVGGSELSSDALCISATHPLVLFSSSQSSVSLLETLYSYRALGCLLLWKDSLKRVMETLCETENVNSNDGNVDINSNGNGNDSKRNVERTEFHLSKLFLLLHNSSLLPPLVNEQIVSSTVNYILGRHSEDMTSCFLSEVQLIEILYGLSQIIFGGNTETFSPRPDALVLQRESKDTEFHWVTDSDSALDFTQLQSLPPQIAIEDEIDRFSCLLQACDPNNLQQQDLLLRLKIRIQNLGPPSQSLPNHRHLISQKNENDNQVAAAGGRAGRGAGGGGRGAVTAAAPAAPPPPVIEFSSNFGYLFTQFLTLSNLYYFQSIVPNQLMESVPFQRFEMPFIQKSLLTLLLLYPINDFNFSPWDLADMISQFSTAREDQNYLLDSASNFSSVQLDLRHILCRFQITGQDFESFLQHILQKNFTSQINSSFLSSLKVQSPLSLTLPPTLLPSLPPTLPLCDLTDLSTHSCLMESFFPLLPSLFSERNKTLLKEGNMLFIWEFLRCLRGNCRNDFSTQRAKESGFQSKPNPFMEQFHSPFPSRRVFQKRHLQYGYGLSWRAVTQWAIIHRLDCRVCLKWFRLCLLISGTIGLHYSSFILFTILCYVDTQTLTQHSKSPPPTAPPLSAAPSAPPAPAPSVPSAPLSSLSSLSSLTSLTSLTENDVTMAIELFYQTVSKQIQSFQRVSSPQCLFSVLMEGNPNQSLRKEDVESIINATLQASSSSSSLSLPSSSSSSPSLSSSSSWRLPLAIPPRPEPNLWDVSRWLQYCKLIGLTECVVSFPRLWSCYQVSLHHSSHSSQDLKQWDDSVVPPVAIPISSSSISRCLHQLLLLLPPLDSSSSSHSTIDQLLLDHLIPFLAGRIDDQTLSPELRAPPQSTNDRQILFEDLFRYGGNRLITALDEEASWFHELYHSLAEATLTLSANANVSVGDSVSSEPNSIQQQSSEPLLTTVCRYLSNCKLFSLGTVSVLVKQCFGFRTRVKFHCPITPNFSASSSSPLHQPSSSPSLASSLAPLPHDSEVSLSFLEFQELVLRCAFHLWDRIGLTKASLQEKEWEFEWSGRRLYEAVKLQCTPLSSSSSSSSAAAAAAAASSASTSAAVSVEEEMILSYCEECRRSLANVQSDQPIRSKQFLHSKRTLQGGKTWGTDFLTPFLQILKYQQRQQREQRQGGGDLPNTNPSKEKLQLVAEQEANLLKTKELANQKKSFLLISKQKKEEDEASVALSAAALRPQLQRQLNKMNSAKLSLLGHTSPAATGAATAEERLKTVMMRSEELVTNILAKREEYEFHSSISHPLSVSSSSPLPAPEQNKTLLSPASQRVASFQSKERLLKRQERMAQLAEYRHLQRLEQEQAASASRLRPPPPPVVPPPPVPLAAIPPAALAAPPQRELRPSRTQLAPPPPLTPAPHPPTAAAAGGSAGGGGPFPRRSQEMTSSLRTRNPFPSPSPSPSPGNNSLTTLLVDNSLFVGIQEALWPVFATYCSCGDSTDPGKLSGPNLFTLLSKLDILTNHTTLSDIGLLLHQISAHSLALSPFLSSHSSVTLTDSPEHDSPTSSPLLSFEEFLIFLCAFSELRYDGVIHLPSFPSAPAPSPAPSHSSGLSSSELQSSSSLAHEHWLRQWKAYFSHSQSFSKLFHDCILPVVTQSFLLASPDDARERDVYSLLFSLDFLFAMETVEKPMFQLYLSTLQLQLQQTLEISPPVAPPAGAGVAAALLGSPVYSRIIEMFRDIKLIPQVISEEEVKKLFLDIVPKSYGSSSSSSSSSPLRFPQWEWVSCVVAYQAVVHSIERGKRADKIKNLSSLVSEVLTTMVDAMTSSVTAPSFR